MMLLTRHQPQQQRQRRRASLKQSLRWETNRLSPIPEEQSCHDWHENSGGENYSTFHFLINQERQVRGRPALYRSSYLDVLALNQAKRMASEQSVMHSASNIEELQQFLDSSRAGENVQRGENPLVMHEFAMKHHPINRSNILSDCFNEFGVGAATGADGHLYVCQMFRGIDNKVVYRE